MPVESNENFTGRSLTKTLDGKSWTATRSWTITGAATETEAAGAQPLDGSDAKLQGVGESHPQTTIMQVTSLLFTKIGPFSWTANATYGIVEGQLGGGGELPLLLQPARIGWRKGNYGEPTDRDLNNNPLVNAAGDAFDPPPTLVRRERYLRIWRYEPFYDIEKARRFEDRVNSNTFQLGRIMVLPGEVLCESIEPMEEYMTTALAIPIAYDFIIRVRFTAGDVAIQPFQTHLQNKGRRGWYTRSGTPTTGEFCYADGTQCTEPVALDMQGKPIDTTIKVLGGTSGAPTAQTPIACPLGLSLTSSPLSTPKLTSLVFTLVRSADFSGLGL